MTSKLKLFGNMLDVAFSKAFLGSQSIARKVLKDKCMAAIRPDIDGKEFEIATGIMATEIVPAFNESIASGRSNGAGIYSKAYREDHIPSVFHSIIRKHQQDIVRFLGKDYLYEPPLFFRTYRMPQELETYDVYSNVWHQDSHDGERLLKIFVCLMDIGPDDGPFMYLNRKDTLKYWSELMERWDFEKIAVLPHFPEQQYATGQKGAYLIINTANCMHRASIPQNFRDMMQITLYPSWCDAPDRKLYAVSASA